MVMCGIVIGIVIMYSLALHNIKKEGGRELIEPKIFGDIRICKVKSSESVIAKTGVYNSLLLEKDGNIFLKIYQLNPEKASEFLLFNDYGNLILRMSSTQEKQGWDEGLSYGPTDSNEKPVQGEQYIDFNLDGSFDLVYNFNERGKFEKILAHINNKWKLVEGYDPKEFIFFVEGEKYSVDYWKQPNSKDVSSEKKVQTNK